MEQIEAEQETLPGPNELVGAVVSFPGKCHEERQHSL
jgi:hypothetical protein